MSGYRLLLFSNSTNYNQPYLEHALPVIRDFLGPAARTVAFVPFAGVTFSYDEYSHLVSEKFATVGLQIESVHDTADPAKLLRTSDGIAVGGGNTFRLLQRLYELGLRRAIREAVTGGKPYIGWSAGANIACPTIRTTNDMPVVEPPSFDALDLVPFQINPHYLDAHPEGHQGETREQRLLEFLELNPALTVVGLREGSSLRVEDDTVSLLGGKTMRLFRTNETPREIGPDQDLSFLLTSPAQQIRPRPGHPDRPLESA